MDGNTLLSDSAAIANFIVRKSGKTQLLGADQFEQAQTNQWMQFLRQETTPLVKAIQWYTFGHAECTAEEYNYVYSLYKENIKILNNHVKTTKFMVGSSLTISDIYLVLTQVEMQQCLMDTNFKNSLQFINNIFKHVTTEVSEFKKRMGTVKGSKKQIMPIFKGAAVEDASTKAAEQAVKNAKKSKAQTKAQAKK